MSQPLVSILIPCFNAAPWLGVALDSCLAQTWPRCEIILVDDGSSDDSVRLARAYESRGVLVLTQPNRGASAARNAALRSAGGEFIQFLDADDLLAPEKIARQLARAAQAPAGSSFTAHWGRFQSDPAQADYRETNALFADLSPVDYLQRYGNRDCKKKGGYGAAHFPLSDYRRPLEAPSFVTSVFATRRRRAGPA